MFIIEEENAISKHHLKIIREKILGVDFPWYYQLSSTTDKFPFLRKNSGVHIEFSENMVDNQSYFNRHCYLRGSNI